MINLQVDPISNPSRGLCSTSFEAVQAALPFEYRRRPRQYTLLHRDIPHWSKIDRLVPIRANGQPAWGEHRRDPVTGVLHVTGVFVVGLAGDQVCEMTRSEVRRSRRTSASPGHWVSCRQCSAGLMFD